MTYPRVFGVPQAGRFVINELQIYLPQTSQFKFSLSSPTTSTSQTLDRTTHPRLHNAAWANQRSDYTLQSRSPS